MYGLHFDHHTLSIARDGELLANEPLAVETVGARAALRPRGAGRRARPARRGVARRTGASSAATKPPRATWRSRCIAHLRALGVDERIDAVVAVPADLDAAALTSLRGALQRRGRRRARLRRCRDAHRRGGRRARPLRRARCRLALRHRDARRRRRRMRLRRSLRERARQPARRLRSVAHRRGRAPWSRTRASIRC